MTGLLSTNIIKRGKNTMSASLIHSTDKSFKHDCTMPLETLRRTFQGKCHREVRVDETLFYCNNPEEVFKMHLADNGKFLTRNTVQGVGSIYTWHANRTNSPIHNTILAHNPNPFTIRITCTGYGTINQPYGSDVLSWKNYFESVGHKVITIPAYGYASLFTINNIPANNTFGVLSRYVIDADAINPNICLLYTSRGLHRAHSPSAAGAPYRLQQQHLSRIRH